MLLWCAIILTWSVSFGEKIVLEPGKAYTYTSNGYPKANYNEGQESFEFSTSPGAQIITICTDFRVIRNSNPCENFAMTITDGKQEKKYCENGAYVEFRSAGSWLKVEMKYKMGGLISCLARSTADPPAKVVVVEPGRDVLILEYPKERTPFLDNAWIFKSSNGKDLTAECLSSFGRKATCNQDIVIYGVGSERIELCESKSFVVKGREIYIRGILGVFGEGFIRCYASVEEEQRVTEAPPRPQEEPSYEEPPKVVPIKSSFSLNSGQIQDFTLGQHHHEIDFTSSGNIHLFCDYIYSHSKQCHEVSIETSEGVKYCAESSNFNYFSKGSSVKIISKFRDERPVKCKAVTMPKGSEVSLKVIDGVHQINHEGDHVTNFNKAWDFKTAPGTKLSIQCDISFTSHDDQTVCTEAVLRIDDGEKEQQYCGAKKIVAISKSTSIKLAVQIMAKAHGNFFCKIQTITGPHPNQIDNLVIPTSAENAGVGRGRKGTNCACGRRNQRKGSRIVNGQTTREGEYTWMVGIRDHGNWQRCGGSILTPYHVLTAAHCMTDSKVRKKYEVTETVIYVGAYNLYNDASHGKTKGYEVVRTFIPEEYWEFKRNYDIAVLYLKDQIEFNEFVGPVCISPSPPKLVNTAIKAIGWGQTEKGYAAPELLETKLFVKSKSDCYNQNYIICTNNKDSSVCYGDSGGPLTYLDEETNLYTQIGIASYVTAPYCQSASGFANVTYHWKYIMDAIKETKPSAVVCQKLD